MIILDVLKMQSAPQAHEYLKSQLQFPQYYGANLDALFDCLTDLGKTEIAFLHEEQGSDYFARVRRVFADAAAANPLLVISEALKANEPTAEEEESTADDQAEEKANEAGEPEQAAEAEGKVSEAGEMQTAEADTSTWE